MILEIIIQINPYIKLRMIYDDTISHRCLMCPMRKRYNNVAATEPLLMNISYEYIPTNMRIFSVFACVSVNVLCKVYKHRMSIGQKADVSRNMDTS